MNSLEINIRQMSLVDVKLTPKSIYLASETKQLDLKWVVSKPSMLLPCPLSFATLCDPLSATL